MGREAMSRKVMPLATASIPILVKPVNLEMAVALKYAFLDFAESVREQAEEDPEVKAAKAELAEAKKKRDELYNQRSPDFFDADAAYKSKKKLVVKARRPYTSKIRAATTLANYYKSFERDFVEVPVLTPEDVEAAAEALKNQRKLAKK